MGFDLIFQMYFHYNETQSFKGKYKEYFSHYCFDIKAEIEKNGLDDVDVSQPDEKVYEFYNKINDFVLIPTLYWTPLGLKTINFDDDRLYYLTQERHNLGWNFDPSDNILELLHYIDLIYRNRGLIIRQALID